MSEPGEVWRVNADGREARLLFTVNGYAVDFSWSPDGSKIAFVSNRSGKRETWVVNVDGSDLHPLTQPEGEVGFPVWVRP
jgi:TolB protein